MEPWWSLRVALGSHWCGFGVPIGWLSVGFEVPLYSQVYGFVVALMSHWCGFEVALYSGVYAEYMPTIWLCGGFGWLWRDFAHHASRFTFHPSRSPRFSAKLKCRSLSRSSPQGEPGGFLPRSMPHLMFGRLRSTSASMNGRMFRRTPSFRSGCQPRGCCAPAASSGRRCRRVLRLPGSA